jgi:hypothetical protein
MSGRVKIVELPIFRKQWLYHAWVDPLPGLGSANQIIKWREGNGLEEKLQLLGKRISTSVRLGCGPGNMPFVYWEGHLDTCHLS